jgi:hypothetical protein
LKNKSPQAELDLSEANEFSLKFFSREGIEIEVLGDQWELPIPHRHSNIDFTSVENINLKYSIKKCIVDQVSRVSSNSGFQYWSDISYIILSQQASFSIFEGISSNELENRLINLIEDVLNKARMKHKLWSLYRVIQWYIWCSENFPELGFSQSYAQELDAIELPGNPKGEAVRQEDPNKGSLHRGLELQLLINALKEDVSDDYAHLKQKAAVALSIAFGRNPANLTYLKESDLRNLDPEGDEPCYILSMPRIKKRQLIPRDDMVEEYLEPEIAKYILELIESSKKHKLLVEVGENIIEIERPIFFRPPKSQRPIKSILPSEAYNLKSRDITELIKSFVIRHGLISPITGEELHVTSRRLRYTIATGLASEGISKRELARVLDHTDTQHVDVYFELKGKIIEHLDKATAKGFSNYINFFKGNVIENDDDAINGRRDDKHLKFVDEENPNDQSDIGVCGQSNVCHLDPPYSCYLCPKFQPYKHADHEHVLDCLLVGREKRLEKYEKSRLGIQLDEVIAAVAQVVKICEEGSTYD